MKKFLFRFIPILVCCMVLVAPFSVSASSYADGLYDFIGNSNSFMMKVDSGSWMTIPTLSRNFSSVPNLVTFRIDVNTSDIYEQFTVGFYAPKGLTIDNIYLQGPGATSAKKITSNNIGDFVYYEYDLIWTSSSNTNELLANGYIDLFVDFGSTSLSAFNFSISAFYSYSGVKFPLPKKSVITHNELTYFYSGSNNKVTSGVDATVGSFNLGSWYIKSVPFNSNIDGHTVLGCYQDLVTMIFNQTDMPISHPGKISFTIASYSDIDFSAYSYDAVSGMVNNFLPVSVTAGEMYGGSDVAEKYTMWEYTVVIDTSSVDWDSLDYVEISMAVYDFERPVAGDWWFAWVINNIYAHPYHSEVPAKAGFWSRLKDTLSSGFQSVVDAISSIFPGADSGEDFLEDATDKRNELDNAMNQIDSVQKPDISNSGDISNIVSPQVSTAYGNIFTSVIGNEYVVSILLLLGTFMLAGYVLFGKK